MLILGIVFVYLIMVAQFQSLKSPFIIMFTLSLIHIWPPAGWEPHKSVEYSRQVIEELLIPTEAWAVRVKGEEKVVGIIALEPDRLRPDANSRELGYNLAEDHCCLLYTSRCV